MAKLMEKLFPKAAAAGKTLVLPEGMDPRVIKAAKIIADKKMAAVKILATTKEGRIRSVSQEPHKTTAMGISTAASPKPCHNASAMLAPTSPKAFENTPAPAVLSEVSKG